MLAAQNAKWRLERRLLRSAACRDNALHDGGMRCLTGVRLDRSDVVRSRRAAIPSREPRQALQCARWLSISTHCDRLSA